ncbi:MAG: carbon storage regulator CsrA [Rhodopirellula sp.]|nr:carbon storage regulator CsrA [Rhodopirellula sp.]
MLVLSRKTTESIVIGDGVEVRVLEISGGRVRLGINAPADVTVHRSEVAARINEFLDVNAGCQLSAKKSSKVPTCNVVATVSAGSTLPAGDPRLKRRPR